jgi:hypothetical protein
MLLFFGLPKPNLELYHKNVKPTHECPSIHAYGKDIARERKYQQKSLPAFGRDGELTHSWRSHVAKRDFFAYEQVFNQAKCSNGEGYHRDADQANRKRKW